jgi:pimeloyl-ACP methyl ester carboxylesterase
VRLDGLLYVPDGVPASAVIVCHGFDRRGFRGVGLFRDMAEAARQRGFVSLVFDFRGCGSSGGVFGYGWDEQKDLEAAISFLLGRREVKRDGVFVVGHSLGGGVSLYVAERDKLVKGVALWAVPHDHAYNIRRFIIRSRGRLGWYLFLLVSYVDVVFPVSRFWSLRVWGFKLRPRDVRRQLMRLREVDVLKRLDRDLPVLFVNGSGDVLSGLEEAKWNYEAARGPKELVVFDSGFSDPRLMDKAIANHVFQGSEKEVIDKTLLWLQNYVAS